MCKFIFIFLLFFRLLHANEHDSKSGFEVLEQLKWRFGRMEKIYADGGYRGELIDKVNDTLGCKMEITLRSDKSIPFKPLPKTVYC